MWCIIDIDMGQTKQNWQRTDDKILLYIFVFFDKMSTNVANIQLDPHMHSKEAIWDSFPKLHRR